MGCAPTKPLMDTTSHQGIHKLKMENGYVRGSRKSNSGGRNFNNSGGSGGRGGGGKAVSGGGKEGTRRSSGSGGGSSSGGGRGGSDGGGVIRRSGSGRSDDLEELVDGWPKWLTDNVPKHALDGLVPKSAEAYDKLDKVIT